MLTKSEATDTLKVEVDNVDAIARQKERAIQYWNDSKKNYDEAMKDQVHDDVKHLLHQGKVLPIFHTLCRPPKERLFPPNTRVSSRDESSTDMIQLSALPVTVGKCDLETPCTGKISMMDERSYIPAFFNNDEAMFRVEDSNFHWEFDEDNTEIATDLVNAPADMIGEDLEATTLLRPLAVDKFSGLNLITRRLSRGVVADCFKKSKAGSTYAIVGNPGIDKSWTLIYALQQALLYDNVCVLLCFQKENMANICIRKNNKIFVWKDDNWSWETSCRSRLFHNSNVVVLLDPRESKKGGAAFAEGARMRIMAASNNALHFGATRKFTPNYARILSINSDEEIKVAIPFMIENQISSASVEEI